MKKKLLALLLAALMVVSLVPVTVFATGTSYAITNGTAQDANGSITVAETAASGATVTVTVTPDKGYQLKSLVVLSAVSLAPPIIPAQDAQDETKYTFTMPDHPVIVKVEFESATPATHSFTYTANNGKITATCTAGCDKGYDTTPLTLTLTAPASLVYDGNAKAFTFADGEATAWTGAGLELPTIIYNIKQSGQSTYLPLFGTLKSVGNYMAQITVGEKTAQVYFSIEAPHTHNLVKVNGQTATETAAGWRDYYECKDSADACHKYFEDATAKVEITDLNAWKAQGGAGYIPKLGDKKIITEISLSLTKYTRDNISFTSIPYPEAKITGITEGNEDVKLETGYIYFFDKDGKWIYSCLFSGSEAKPVWYDMSSYKVGKDGMEGEKVIDTAPDYSKIKKAIVNVLATSKNGFAPELKVTVNGKALGVSKMVEGTYNADTMAGYQVMEQDAYFFVPFDIADSTTSPKTGDTSNMALWVMLLSLSSTGLCACLVLGKKRRNVQ